MDDRTRSLKEALHESLSAILSPIHDVRSAGEEQVKALELTDEFGVNLAEFALDPRGALAIRQLSSVLLKQYVEVHWCQHAEKFQPPEVNQQAKARIRSILPDGLRETISKVRTSVAYAISAIAHWDWPDDWPDLLQILMLAITSGDACAVHGAMRVLTEFCREVTDTQMPQVAPIVLPEMYKIFTQDQLYSIRTRARAVDIYNTCTGIIATMSELHRNAAKQLLYPVLPQFMNAFVQTLTVPDGMTSDCGLKMEVMKALTTSVKSFPKVMSRFLPQILEPVWTALTESVHIYVTTVVNNTADTDEVVDSDGEVLGFENLVFSVFEFIHGLIETSKYRPMVKKVMGELLYFIVLYLQITEDQIRMWNTNPDQFVEDEDDDSFSYSVRISAQDLLLSLAYEFPNQCAVSLCEALTRHLHESEASKNRGDPHWWKIHESSMLAVGSCRSLLVDQMSSGKIQFDLNAFLQSVVLCDMNQPVSPYLLGRCMWVASRFTSSMAPEMVHGFIRVTVQGLHQSQPASVRISAVRAVFNFCDHLKQTDNRQLIAPFLSDILDGIFSVAMNYSTEVLALCLESLNVVLSVDKQFTADCENKVAPLAMAVFLKHSSDPMIVSLVEDIFKELSLNPGCRTQLQQRLLPTLCNILLAGTDKVPMGLQSVALDMLETLVRGSGNPLSELLINQAFPAACRCTLSSDDNATLQSGGECLRAFASVSLEQVISWTDDQGNDGLLYIIQVVSKLLDPKTSEFTATFVGRLVSILISKVGVGLGDKLDLILRMVLSKMHQAETLSVMQSLVMVFAHLIHSQMEAVLNFLCSVPDPTGKPALQFVLEEWLSRQHLFYGSYEGKVSAVALCKLLEHAVKSNDERFHGIQVKGDPVLNAEGGIRTRSKTAQAPEEWTQIPVIVKVYKLLINELSNQLECNLSTTVSAGDAEEEGCWEEDDDDEVEEEDDDEGDVEGNGLSLTSILSQYAQGFDGEEANDEEEEDPDVVEDPLNQVQLQKYLTEYLRAFSQQPCYSLFSAHHNESEKTVLRTIGIPA